MNQLLLPGLEAPITEYHDFKQQLSFANVNTTPDQLNVFYSVFFPWLVNVEKVTDCSLQKQGIDTILTFENGKTVYFDEKIRKKDYGDILLEEFSVWHDYPCVRGNEIGKFEEVPGWRRAGLVPGWLSGKKVTDYITYFIKPSKKVYFMPFLLLQSAWQRNYHNWLRLYGRKAAPNRRYHTTNIPVTWDVLCEAMYEAQT